MSFLTGLLLAMPLASSGLQPQPSAPVPSPVVPAGTMPARGIADRARLEAFLDGLLMGLMTEKKIAGVTVSVVKDGALFFAKGYGYADVDARKPVDPERSMFRIGSVSKLFTWTAVMQLVEQGKLDLNKDVNEYLDFKIPATYPEPITLTHILTHTPGFEEDGRDLFTTDSTHMKPMSQWLPSHMPERVRAPGTFSSYSNWATALAGYIVERVSGQSYDEYLEQHLFGPLGMDHSTARQPLPGRFAADMSKGYSWTGGRYQSKEWEIVTGAAPAGSMSASATDMAKFMLAHLGNGAFGDARILSEATARQMHTRIQGHDPRIPGFAYGFYEKSQNGLRIIGHGGDTQWFHTDLALIPSENLGIFMSTNTDKGGSISFGPFLAAVLDHFYPETIPVLAADSSAKASMARFAGQYLFNRMNFSTYQKALGLFSAIPIDVGPDGALIVGSPFGAMRLARVDSLLFRDDVSGALLAFGTDQSGQVTHAALDMVPMMVLDKQPGLRSPRLHQVLLGLGVITFLGILVSAVLRWFRRRAGTEPQPAHAVAGGRRLMAIAALLMVLFLVAIALIASNPTQLFGDSPTSLKVALLLPVLALLLTLGGLWFAIQQWRLGQGSLGARLRHSGAVLVALVFFWSLNVWNLLGWRM
ncbi:MAG: serine hydrolase [Gemmatimonadetes bacterium]|nr:serine hydrolase [Gemmatimonadota bacterium]